MKNNSGICPKCFRVLVQIDRIDEKTKGGIIIPHDTLDRESMAQARGVVLAIGGDAFSDMRDRVSVGETVIFPRYEGTEIKGNDEGMYRLIEDKFIIGVIEKQNGGSIGISDTYPTGGAK